MKSHSMNAWLAVPLVLRLRLRLHLHLLLLCFVSSSLVSSWTYTNSSSWEDKWSSVASQMCSGSRQSPIPLSVAESHYNPHLKPITVYDDYGFRPYEKFTVTNNGHTLMVTLPSCHYFLRLKANGGGRFCIVQFHFHWGKDSSSGSEHSIDGKFFPLEMHVVTFDNKLYDNFSAASTGVNGLAVLALMFQEDPNIPVTETVLYKMGAFLQKVDEVQQPGQKAQLDPFPVEAFLNVGQANERYYRYEGSLTTPPCTENVYWTVIAQPVPVSPQQLRAMRVMRYPEEEKETFMANNYRGIQSINSGDVVVPRLVFRSWNAATRVAFASLPLLSAALFLARL